MRFRRQQAELDKCDAEYWPLEPIVLTQLLKWGGDIARSHRCCTRPNAHQCFVLACFAFRAFFRQHKADGLVLDDEGLFVVRIECDGVESKVRGELAPFAVRNV